MQTNQIDSKLTPLITVLGGVAEVFEGDAIVIDFDDWNDDDTPDERRQEIIEDIQAAGYRCIVWGLDGDIASIQIFKPSENYDVFITEQIHTGFVVYDPKENN